MTLDKLKKGQTCRIVSIDNMDVRTQAIRFGIAEGELVSCAEIVPAGPVIIRKNRQEIAFGRSLAKKINVILH